MVIKHRCVHREVCLIYRARLTICGQQPCRLSYGAAKVTKPPAPQWSCEKNYERLRKEKLKLCSSDISLPVITYGNLPVSTDAHNAWELTALDGLTPLLPLPCWDLLLILPRSQSVSAAQRNHLPCCKDGYMPHLPPRWDFIRSFPLLGSESWALWPTALAAPTTALPGAWVGVQNIRELLPAKL